ncbi:MAG: hypothetical protein V1913_09730 [Fibrobacterota bacterium]
MTKFFLFLFMALTFMAVTVTAEEGRCTSLDSMERPHGHQFAYMTGIFNWDMAPIERLAKSDPLLRPFQFDFSDNLMMTHTFQFLWGRKDDGRAGFAFSGGFKRYSSNSVARPLLDSLGNVIVDSNSVAVTRDSLVDLMTVIGYGGFVMEKGRSFGALNVYGGGLIGGGAWVVVRDEKAGSQPSAFHSGTGNGLGDSGTGMHDAGMEAAVAPLWVLDLHAGVTYTFVKRLHTGLEGSALMLYAPDGFSPRSETFNTFNPGLRLKLVFGSLG